MYDAVALMLVDLSAPLPVVQDCACELVEILRIGVRAGNEGAHAGGKQRRVL